MELPVLVLTVAFVLATISSANAYQVDPALGNVGGNYLYKQNIAGWDPVFNAGESVWDTQDLTPIRNWVRSNQSQPKKTLFAFLDGAGGTLATGTWGCAKNGVNGQCNLRMDVSENWYTGAGQPGPGQHDARGVIAHEFGHWHGLGHSSFIPSSDPGQKPTMHPGYSAGQTYARTTEQDDINGFLRSWANSPRLTANKSIEYGAAHWEWKPPSGGAAGSYQYRTDNNTPWGRDYIRIANQCATCDMNASIRQQISQVGPPGSTMTAQAHLRGVGGNVSALLVVWNLNTGTPHVKSCTAPSGSWIVCNNSLFSHTSNFNVYVEVYNTSPWTSLDIDMIDAYV
ncbi:MAG: matrixin family metalloprotease [Actinomycetia bacterium]|nr:matrixin family metalloprotease [Actinomycetes bacterium]